MSGIFDFFLILIAFIFTFLIPGYLVIQTFYKDLPILYKWPLIMVLSVLLSTYSVFFTSLIIGYSRYSILLVMILYLIWGFILLFKKIPLFSNFKSLNEFIKVHIVGLIFSTIILNIFILALSAAIFTFHNNYIVMAADNWQDTAMHQSIIESISQGNFPPQAPYFSGAPLTYYYFADFHASIIETFYGKFFPRVLVYDNSLFAFIFSFSIYCLAFYITKNRFSSFLSSFIVMFNSNLMFIKFFQDLFRTSNPFSINNVTALIGSHGYTIEFGKLFQFSPITDYFLQNRPMMVGLPAVTLVFFLILFNVRQKKNKYLLLAGIITGLLIKFQLFGFVVNILAFFIISILYLDLKNKRHLLIQLLIFLTPSLIVSIFFSIFEGNSSQIQILKESFSLSPWENQKSIAWFILFTIANFGLPFLISIIYLIVYFFGKVRLKKEIIFLFILSIILFSIPHIVTFTIYPGDMFKFFYFMMISISIITGLALTKIWKISRLGIVLVILVLLVSSLTATLNLGASFFNKFEAYKIEEYLVGIWIRDKVPQRSVFVTMPTVHSPVTDIGGRLRVISYINWPYSHGFNRGPDNVFTRLSDVARVYQTESPKEQTELMNKYSAKFIYLGWEEKNKFPKAIINFSNNPNLKFIYSVENIQIYQLI